MKRSALAYLLILGVLLTLGGTGCKNPKKPLTPIPAAKASPTTPPPRGAIGGGNVEGLGPGAQGIDTAITPNTTGIPAAGLENFEDRQADREAFRDFTIYFDFDRSSIRANETSKLQSIADHLKQNPNDDLAIEGHCDERGTSEYNRSLGERRAQSAREFLVNQGVSAARIRTISYGEDKPAVIGTDEAAYAKNRRCEFLKLLPKTN
ncbi:MAG TPA: peptidoglycan-associated lipoprotein Pal [Candidatus Paceibacterota bacterium]|nr:peptidoglycan-associated lipoprotein Pal [Verrucomicrobiota bacterium]HRY48222.1 peptidoglycan-associated lipoprotein Pal [Candidatus Paceibacterota bacterium]HSA00399.1 peptidoglycan-associated lipoprotein Pal [Candidatus Paceibacterota bacterium]